MENSEKCNWKNKKTSGIEKINIDEIEVTDMKVIAEKCNEHFVSFGDKLVKEIQTNDEQSPTAHLKSSAAKFKFKTISVMQVIKALKSSLTVRLLEFMVSPIKH